MILQQSCRQSACLLIIIGQQVFARSESGEASAAVRPSLTLSPTSACRPDMHVSRTSVPAHPGTGRAPNPKTRVLLPTGRHVVCGVSDTAWPGDVHGMVLPISRGLRSLWNGLLGLIAMTTSSGACGRAGKRCWRGRCRSCPTSHSLGVLHRFRVAHPTPWHARPVVGWYRKPFAASPKHQD